MSSLMTGLLASFLWVLLMPMIPLQWQELFAMSRYQYSFDNDDPI